MVKAAHTQAHSHTTHASRQPFSLSQWAKTASARHDGKSGFHLLTQGGEAFAVRATSTACAEHTLDIQTYILEDGHSTRRLIALMIEAANRGVRVRLLVDDLTVGGQQKRLAMLDAHPLIEVRLFNPIMHWRRTLPLRYLWMACHVRKLHRRMHNKLWLVDDALAIVGGRNLSDDYFSVNVAHDFIDVDVVAVGGDVPRSLKQQFDAYWNHTLSVPLSTFVRVPTLCWRALYALCTRSVGKGASYGRSLDDVADATSIESFASALHWANAKVMWDLPDKIDMPLTAPHARRMSQQVGAALNATHHQLFAVSGYFVPEHLDAIDIAGMAHRGVKITVITNALEASDVPLVHGGYAPHRQALLEAGVVLYETRRQHVKRERLPCRRRAHSRPRLSSTQAYSLHSKVMALDDDRVIVGSFNLDPRSVWWNSEVGVLIESPTLNAALVRAGQLGMQLRYSYELQLRGHDVAWRTTTPAGTSKVLFREPAGLWRRLQAWVSERLGLARYL